MSFANLIKGKRNFIFDFDGTIGDTLPIHEKAFTEALKGVGGDFDYSLHHGKSTSDTVKSHLDRWKIDLPQDEIARLIKSKQSFANQKIGAELGEIRGATSLIKKLHQLDLNLFVASSGSKKNVMAGLQKLGIEHYFKKIYTTEDVTKAKPEPEIFLKPVADFNLDPNETLVIEDAASGIQAAVNAGMNVVCIAPHADEMSNPLVHYYTYQDMNDFLDQNKQKNTTLCGIVTFNRKALLSRCIKAVKAQSTTCDILVINNGSTDGTENYLKETGVTFITQENLGSAGGWARLISYSAENDYEYIWLMDDDGFPHEYALKHLLENITQGDACVSSTVVKENSPNEFVFPMPKLNANNLPVIVSKKRKYTSLDELGDKKAYEFAHLFNGALIKVDVLKKTGNVSQGFFMYGDEVDMFCRLRSEGKVRTIFDAIHYHPDVSQRAIDDKRLYYFIRNTIYLNNKYFDKPHLRNLLTVGVALFRVYKKKGFSTMTKYILGAEKKFVFPAVSDGYKKKISKKF